MSNIVKYYNGFPIEFDWMNGQLMANATAMCAAFGKRANDWGTSAGAVRYINALQAKPEIPVLVETRQGGTNPGTWIHERLILKLAQWLNVDFEIQCDEWIAELLRTGTVELAHSLPKTLSQALRLAADKAEEVEVLQLQLTEAQPAKEFYAAVFESNDAIPIADAAKVLGFPDMGQNKLFEFLRERRVLMSTAGHWNMPYQEFVNRGYFKIVERRYDDQTGQTRISLKTLVYQKGLDYIRKLVLASL